MKNNNQTVNFADKFELRTGSFNQVGAVCKDDEPAAWLVLHQGKTLHTISEREPGRFYDALDMFCHIANGDYADWKPGEHYPKYPVQTTDEFVQAEESLTNNGTYLKMTANGWAKYRGDKLMGLAEGYQPIFHDRVDYVLNGDSVALHIVGYLANEYAREVLATLQLGVGKTWAARTEKLLHAKEEKQQYQLNRALDTTGEYYQKNGNGQPKAIRVMTDGNVRINMTETVAPGTLFHIVTASGHDDGVDHYFDPNDDAQVDALVNLGSLLRVKVIK